MAGYSDTPLARKLGIEEGKTVGILNMPNYFDLDLGELPPDVEVHRTELPADIFIVFADRADEAERGFQRAITYLPADGAIWVLWPKKSSGVETDLSEQTLRDLFLPTGMVDNKVIAVDDTWSGLRFVVRKENRESWPAGGLRT
ncbi:MAG TPA: DUF3052 domain-containing protein [Acidimicrobiia bacterium]|nr:DUF3052 domain-containing protein [Acidimicrobiia bacterium]